MDTTQQPEVRIRVTPLRRLSGGTYVPRGGQGTPVRADEAPCAARRTAVGRAAGRTGPGGDGLTRRDGPEPGL
ncbi:hypothetical protein, partial [Streptomyces tauricus]|uniref:hypothetical protein n=1 Tax=Streptomyces tauricus TaxID=68274 RepID=UPI0033A8BEC9